MGVELRDANIVTMHNVLPIFFSLNLSTLCTEVDVKYSAFFEGCVGCSPGRIKKTLFLISFVIQGMDAILSACYVLPPAKKFFVYYWLNTVTCTISTASKYVRVYVRNNKTNRKDSSSQT